MFGTPVLTGLRLYHLSLTPAQEPDATSRPGGAE
jgi:hypothetical protein